MSTSSPRTSAAFPCSTRSSARGLLPARRCTAWRWSTSTCAALSTTRLGYDSDEERRRRVDLRAYAAAPDSRPVLGACESCDLRDRCYAFHNARTFQDPVAGPKVLKRLKTIYTLTHLRGRMHITLRDMRSALAYMLVGTRDCQQIHELYQAGDRDAIAQSFYFNSWMGGDQPTGDRLLNLLKDMDMGASADPRLDRGLDFVSPTADRTLFRFDLRGDYDRDVLRSLFADLPRDYSGHPTRAAQRGASAVRGDGTSSRVLRASRRWLAQMLPYRSAERMISLVAHGAAASTGSLAEVAARDQSGRRAPRPQQAR